MLCAFCGEVRDAFLPFGGISPVLEELRVVGGGRRPNAKCPVCGSLDRERAVYIFLKTATDIFIRRTALLHVAPEPCLSSILRSSPTVSCVAIDLRPRRHSIVMDVRDIRIESNSFDVILCNHVLEHVENDSIALLELYRVLKPGGWAILQVPVATRLAHTYEDPGMGSPEERTRAFGQADHVRLYGRDYPERLALSGFIVETVSLREKLGPSAVVENALIPEEKLYVAHKPGNSP